MPIRADIEAATPRCPKIPQVRTMAGLERVGQDQCYIPLKYRVADNMWSCPKCGHMVTGERLGARDLTAA